MLIVEKISVRLIIFKCNIDNNIFFDFVFFLKYIRYRPIRSSTSGEFEPLRRSPRPAAADHGTVVH